MTNYFLPPSPFVREHGEVVHELRGSPLAIWVTMIDAAICDGEQVPPGGGFGGEC